MSSLLFMKAELLLNEPCLEEQMCSGRDDAQNCTSKPNQLKSFCRCNTKYHLSTTLYKIRVLRESLKHAKYIGADFVKLDCPNSSQMPTRNTTTYSFADDSEDTNCDRIRIEASLEEVSKTTHGKMYKSTEVHVLVKMTQNMAKAANMIENGFDFTESSVDNPGVAEKIIRYTNGEDWEDIVLLGKFMQRNSNFNNNTELEDSNLPPLGSRVRRKPGWRYGDQDKGRPGTVIGHDKDRMSVWVEWDHGKANVYKCHALFGQDVILVEEPRILKDEIIAVGCFVERGDDWNYGDQDGGIGSVGVVLNVNANGLIIEKKGMPSQAAGAEKTEPYLSSDSSSVEVAWAYKKDGKWYNLPRAVNEKVEKAYGRNKQGATILELDGCINHNHVVQKKNVDFRHSLHRAGLNKDPNDQPDIKDFNSWITLAEKERQKGLSMNFLKTGQGPDTCLLLDLSGSMVGEPFNEMMVAVRTFVEGIASVFATQGIEENLGIATFGEQTGVIQHMTNDYDKVLEALDLLVPSGPSPMAAGLYMALACCFGHGCSPMDFRLENIKRMVALVPFLSIMCVIKSVWLKETAEYLEKQSIRVYAVSVCSMEPASLEQVSETTHGKMFKSTEINKLVKMTQNTATAAKLVENGFDFTDSQVDDPEVKEEVLRYNLQGEWEDIVLQGKYIEKNYNINHYTELEDSNLPPLGSRVRRKPGWRYGDQDKGRPGTVVGHHKDRMSVFVEWDHGALIIYKSHTHFGQDVILVNEPRVLRDEIIAVGCCVKRGVDWKYGNEDGGLESIGVVLKVNANGLIIVRWPNKNKHQYRFGFDGLFDVQLCDGVKSSGRKEMPSQAADAESTEAYIASGSSSDHLENREIYHGESKDDRSNKTKKRPMSIKEFNERNRQLQTKEGKRTPAVQTNFKTDDVAWAYKKDGIWYTLPRDVNEKVEKAYGRNKHGSTILELNGCMWVYI
uniref:E3 ubiquitin-protein ligase MIB2 n=1 Tax=Magallana gigas TaxID=29159 RepID=K1Q222_MAGGI